MDRFFCAASRFSNSSSSFFSTTAATSTTSTAAAAKAQAHIPCGLCGNNKHSHTHSVWERCTPVKKNMSTLATTAPPRSNSMYGILQNVIKNEGTAALWDGLRPALLLSSINVVLYMIAYDELSKDILPNQLGWSAGVSTIVAGGLSRAGAGIIVSPLELIRTQMQSSSAVANKGIMTGMQSMIQKDGVFSLWRGYSATMWRDVPFSIVYWYGFEQIKATILEPSNNVPISDNIFLTSFVAGAGSGSFAAFATTPFDVIKTRRQVMQGKEARTARLLLDIVQSEGVPALFSGVAPRVIKVAPACGMLIGIYHLVQEVVAPWLE